MQNLNNYSNSIFEGSEIQIIFEFIILVCFGCDIMMIFVRTTGDNITQCPGDHLKESVFNMEGSLLARRTYSI